MKSSHLALALAGCVLTTAGCASMQTDTGHGSKIDPARFTSVVDNPYFPLVPGTTYRYSVVGDDGPEDVVVTVTGSTRVVAGVTCVVVHDVSSSNGKVREDTWDWYAQDEEGAVWYFGEDTKAYERGHVSTEGSWEAGVNGAKPGIVMPARPRVGVSYRQEYLAGEAEDMAEVIAVDASATVPYGTFRNCVQTKDWTPLEPESVENKYYAPGVGMVLAVKVQGGTEREELVSK